jgi:hypothetical protein
MAKVGINLLTSSLTSAKLNEFIDRFFGGRRGDFLLPSRDQTIMTPPEGYVGMYVKTFTLANVRYPFTPFFLAVLNQYDRHISVMHPQGLSKIMAFEVVCRAYGGEPSVDLFRTFATLCDAGEWVTIGNRAKGKGCFLKGGVDIRNWKKEFFFMRTSLFPDGYQSLVDRGNLVVKEVTVSDLPDVEASGPLFEKLRDEHFVVRTYPNSVLFRARVIDVLPDGEEEIDGKGFRLCFVIVLQLLSCNCFCLLFLLQRCLS